MRAPPPSPGRRRWTSNATGFPLTAADQLGYDTFLTGAAHARGLAVGLENDLGQAADLAPAFEWALVEECFQYGECSLLQPLTAAGKPVFEIEYGTQALATTVCPKANALGFETLVKNLALDAWRISCRREPVRATASRLHRPAPDRVAHQAGRLPPWVTAPVTAYGSRMKNPSHPDEMAGATW